MSMTDEEADIIIDQFFSGADYDFSKAEDWKKFLNRRVRSAPETKHKAQLSDFKPYPVGYAQIFSSGHPSEVRMEVATQFYNHPLPVGHMYIYYPDESWKFHVRQEYLGPPDSSCDFYFQVGGGGSPTRPNWGGFYYIPVKQSILSGTTKFAANQMSKKILNEALSTVSGMLRNGTKLLRMGGAFYITTVYVDGKKYQSSFCGSEQESCAVQTILAI